MRPKYSATRYQQERIRPINFQARRVKLIVLGDILITWTGLILWCLFFVLAFTAIQQGWSFLLIVLLIIGLIATTSICTLGLKYGFKSSQQLRRLERQYTILETSEMYPPLGEKLTRTTSRKYD